MATKVLIVDDEPHIRSLIHQTIEELEDDGVELLTADNGQWALESIQAERPQLVFLDVIMPKMNGFVVCHTVKRKLALNDVHIVLLTAKGQEVDHHRGDEAAADVYMTKLFDPDALLAHARQVLRL